MSIYLKTLSTILIENIQLQVALKVKHTFVYCMLLKHTGQYFVGYFFTIPTGDLDLILSASASTRHQRSKA